MISAAVSKYRSPPIARRTVENAKAVSVPSAMSVSMSALRVRARSAVTRRIGHPAQNWTGAAHAEDGRRAHGSEPIRTRGL